MRVITRNKRARFDYEIVDSVDAGIVLAGHEVKAIKNGQVNINDAIVKVQDREVWLINMDVPLYKKADHRTVQDYQPKGRRKLLLTARQITRLAERTNKTGLTILPLRVYADKRRRIKVTIGLGKRKKNIQKRAAIKARDTERLMDKEIKRWQ